MIRLKSTRRTEKITIWQIIILVLSVYVLTALFIETVFRLPEETSKLLGYLDTIICIIFISDFFQNLIKSKPRLKYLKWGWIDLISSIPNIYFLRWGRIVRLVRILRILRTIRSTKLLLSYFYKNPSQGAFGTVALFCFILMIFSTIAILNCEISSDSNIRSAADALWWSFVTITTVGYGDHYPVTNLGRIIAAFVMIAGVGLFGTFTAYVASLFIEPQDSKEQIEEVIQKLDQIEQKLLLIEKHLRLQH